MSSYPILVKHKKSGRLYKYAGYEELYDYHNGIYWGVYYPYIRGNIDTDNKEVITSYEDYEVIHE